MCPIETQRFLLGLQAYPFVEDAGWLYVNLNTSTGSPTDPFAQAWVSTLIHAEGRHSLGMDAIRLDDACDPNTVILTPPPSPRGGSATVSR